MVLKTLHVPVLRVNSLDFPSSTRRSKQRGDKEVAENIYRLFRMIRKNLELVIREMHTRGCVGPTPVCRKVPLVFVFPWIFLGAQKAEVKLAVDFRHRHKKTTEVQRLKIQQNSPHVFAEMGKASQ